MSTLSAAVVADRATTNADRPTGSTPLLPVVGSNLSVPLVTGDAARYVNLDYAATAPALASVAERVAQYLTYYSSVHRGAGWPSVVSTTLYEQSRETVAEFVGARPDDVVVFTRNTTDSLNLLASVVPEGCHVIHLDAEHHGNLLSWERCDHTVVPVRRDLKGTLAALEAALAAVSRRAGRNPVPAMVAVTGASNVTGEAPALAEIVALARAHGARVAVDGAQLVPHRRVDMTALDIDYLAFSGHKLYAPYGTGALVGRRDWLDAGAPYLRGGGAVHEVDRSGTDWAESPARHEGGTPNLLGAIAVAAACEALAALPEGSLQAHEHVLRSRLEAGLAELPDVRMLRIWPDDEVDRVAVVGFTVQGRDPQRVATWLSAEHGIGVRHGRFCAHQLVSVLAPLEGVAGVPSAGPTTTASANVPQALRASLGVGSTIFDVDRLVAALRQLAVSGEFWNYVKQDGQWMPSPDPRSWGPAGEYRDFVGPCRT
jgi:selenocysteine lyase/cysteine desulfurase